MWYEIKGDIWSYRSRNRLLLVSSQKLNEGERGREHEGGLADFVEAWKNWEMSNGGEPHPIQRECSQVDKGICQATVFQISSTGSVVQSQACDLESRVGRSSMSIRKVQERQENQGIQEGCQIDNVFSRRSLKL